MHVCMYAGLGRLVRHGVRAFGCPSASDGPPMAPVVTGPSRSWPVKSLAHRCAVPNPQARRNGRDERSEETCHDSGINNRSRSVTYDAHWSLYYNTELLWREHIITLMSVRTQSGVSVRLPSSLSGGICRTDALPPGRQAQSPPRAKTLSAGHAPPALR